MPQIETQSSSTGPVLPETRTSTVLVVDDDHLSRKLVKKALERGNIVYEGVCSSEGAL